MCSSDLSDGDAALTAQTRRCAIAAELAQACESIGSAACLWVLTQGAQILLRDATGRTPDQSLARAAGQMMPGDEAAFIEEHPAPRQPVAIQYAHDAALWGFARTMMNEASGTTIRVVDLDYASGADVGALHAALAAEMLTPDREAELLLGNSEAGVVRRVPRLSTLERPRPARAGGEDAGEAVDVDGGSTVKLGFEFPGQLRNLRWELHPSPAPASDEVEVDICATGLNFRDVMYALGMLSDEAIENGFAGPTLGLEFSGVVRRVGADVDAYEPGDRVVGFGPSSFGNRMLTKVSAISRMPRNMSFEAAATIPSTFFTVYYAFEHLAHLAPGEKVLIHGAAGGVGIAAIQYAQHVGAEIYATAGSSEKRDFLRLMGVKHIYDSRGLSFADQILADTQGQGVDVVLNSLAGEAVNRNFRVLKPFGRFLELGKRDFYENTRIGLRPFRNNISYFGIDADQLMHARPALTQKLFADMMGLFEQGILHPLPYRVFDATEIVDAFRFMQQARQIGKIVVTYRNGVQHSHLASERRSPKRLALDPQATYLVTGGLAGFGLRTAQWMVERGARHLILVSRSGPTSTEAVAALADFEQRGVQVLAQACDVTDREALAALLEHTTYHLPPLKGIVHAAVVIDDGLIRGMTGAQLQRTLAAKILGARYLHELTAHAALDLFVMFSSATTLLGNPGQSNYVAANSWLEALAAQRRLAGLPATCVKWGAIDDVGFLAQNENIKEALQTRMGGAALSSKVALRALEDIILADQTNLGVMELDWRALSRFLPSASQPKFSAMARRHKHDAGDEGQANDIAVWVSTLPDAELHARFLDVLRHEVGDILRVAPEKIDPAQSIYDMGLDSLMGVELVVALEARFGVRLPVMALNDSPTIAKLADRLIRMLKDEVQDPADGDDTRSQIEQIAAQHDSKLSPAAMEELADQLAAAGDQPNRMIH